MIKEAVLFSLIVLMVALYANLLGDPLSLGESAILYFVIINTCLELKNHNKS